MPFLLLQSLTDFLVLLLWNVHIHSHSLNEQQEKMTILEGGKLWFYPFCCHGNVTVDIIIMELCDECNNCTKFQFHTEEVLEDTLHFLWFYIILRPHWQHKSSTLYKSKLWITQEPRVLLQKNKCHYSSLWNKKDLCHICRGGKEEGNSDFTLFVAMEMLQWT